VGTLRAEVARRFPGVPPPELDVPPDGAAAYAYLKAAVRYTHPFFESAEPFLFTDSSGKQTTVAAFGIRDTQAARQAREQVLILYRGEGRRGLEVEEFILDPCRHSRPKQVVLACVPRQRTLAEALLYARRKAAEGAARARQGQLDPAG